MKEDVYDVWEKVSLPEEKPYYVCFSCGWQGTEVFNQAFWDSEFVDNDTPYCPECGQYLGL